jgi:hypothetical protein
MIKACPVENDLMYNFVSSSVPTRGKSHCSRLMEQTIDDRIRFPEVLVLHVVYGLRYMLKRDEFPQSRYA